ncbi:MAG: SUMF1/EgtB/PvdO family nonheme iron enzyme [Anaerolineae bacterium]|nr:SUMF1/EgtB/PvdO family nonheme iron enzyme [Anaerolineae bacterium]
MRELYRYLLRRRIKPWFDEIDLVGGQDWQAEIPKALATSDAIIICLTKNSVDKEGYIQKEIKFALDKALEMPEGRIFLIPVRFEECDVPFSLSRYQWVDLFDEAGYTRMMKALKFRAAQLERATVELTKKDIEEEKLALEKTAREKQERETAEKAAREKAEREKAEKAAREKLERDVAEKARKEKAEREAAEKAAREKIKREAAEKAKRERAERRAAQIALLKETLSKAFNALRSTLPKAVSFLRIVAISVVLVVLVWLGSWAVPNLFSPLPTANDSGTSRPSATIAFTNSSTSPTNTPKSSSVPTITPISPQTALPTEITDAKGVQMMLVPAGEFTMGSNHGIYDQDEQPIHTVFLDTYYIDKFEVTNSLYKGCVDLGICQPPTDSTFYNNSARENHPVIHVNWSMAKTYCEWRGAHLPTEAEWEKAARGKDGRTFPWGEDISCQNANSIVGDPCVGDTTIVGTYINGVSPYGAFDMAGIWEWTSSLYWPYPYNSTDGRENLVDSGSRVLRGGSRNSYSSYVTTTTRDARDPSDSRSLVGFRCARNSSKSVTPSETPTASDLTAIPLPTEITDAKGVQMVLVPAGEFTMGISPDDLVDFCTKFGGGCTREAFSDYDGSPQRVYLENYYIDRYEVTNALYKICVDESVCAMPVKNNSVTRDSYYDNPVYGSYPIVNVTWNMAKTFCEWRDARLPIEAEWEKAARGVDLRMYPWGDEFDGNSVNFCDKNCISDWRNNNYDDGYADTAPVGSYSKGASPFGIYDMAGNVGEWVNSLYEPYPYLASDGRERSITGVHVMRGGAFLNNNMYVSSVLRWGNDGSAVFDSVGFRCARSFP